MRVIYHPDFPKDVRRIQAQYFAVSDRLGARFRLEVEQALDVIRARPTSAGHFAGLRSSIVRDVRRRDLKAFPFFILYGVAEDRIFIGSLIASRSDPVLWFARLRKGTS